MDEQVILAFANSKFVVIDEMTDAAQLYILKYDEFLEFIARMASLAQFTGSGGWTTPPPEPADEEAKNSDDEEGSGSVINEPIEEKKQPEINMALLQ